MKRVLLVSLLLSAILFSGCTGLHLMTNTPVANAPTVELKQNNFHVVKHVSASESCRYIVGIGGYSKRALTRNATAEMMQDADLEGSQMVVNITTRESVRMFTPFYIVRTVTVHGTVVEFDGPATEFVVELQKN